jgi:hypothetical protein
MMTVSELLAEANACHDDDVLRGAELLRSIDPQALIAGEAPTYAFLINHVLGEKLGCWGEALKCQRRILERPEPTPVLWRQLGAAAYAAGDTAALRQATSEYGTANQVDLARAHDVLQLSAVVYQVPVILAANAGARTLAAITPLTEVAWHRHRRLTVRWPRASTIWPAVFRSGRFPTCGKLPCARQSRDAPNWRIYSGNAPVLGSISNGRSNYGRWFATHSATLVPRAYSR